MSLKDRLANRKFEPSRVFGTGGAGGDAAILIGDGRVERTCDLLGLPGDDAKAAQTALQKFHSVIVFDSDDRERATLNPIFAGDAPKIIETPASYKKLTSPSGREIIEKIKTEPFVHLAAQANEEELLVGKASDSEAEGCRFYGYVNGVINVRLIQRQIATAIESMRNLSGSKAWQTLTGLGLPLSDESHRIDVCGSGAGGQASGILILVLALLAREIEDIRSQCKVHVHFLAPGFHAAQNETEALEQRVKSLSVLRDLAAMKVTGRSLEIPFPGGNLTLRSRHTSEIFNYLTIYEPKPTDSDVYKSFLNQVSQTVLDSTLSASAADLRRALSNANSLARSSFAQKHLAAVVGWKR